MLKERDQAPALSAEDQDGIVHTLSEYAGRWLLLYFYPEDDTSGCTIEACGFRDNFDALRSLVEIVGVSKDSVESHTAFREKYKLPFTLLADPEKKILAAYGVTTDVSKRASFLIDPDGIIRKIYPAVVPEKHAAEITTDLHAFRS